MRTNYFYVLLLILLSSYGMSEAQTTEVFESESDDSSSFTDNGQLFNITSAETYRLFIFNGGGWNGTMPDNRFMDNSDGNNGENNGSSFTISSDSGTDFIINSLYLFCATSGIGNGSGTVTFEGRKDNANVFTFTKTSGFSNVSTFTPNNGFTFIDFANEDTTDHTLLPIDQLIITSTGNFDYLALDAFSWTALAADTVPPSVESIEVVGSPATTADTIDMEVTFSEAATNVSVDDFTIDLTGTATGTIDSSISGSGTTYTLTITGIAGEGSVSVDLNANTDIIDSTGNGNGTNGNTPAFTLGEAHTVSSCFEESFEGLMVGATTFSSNGIDFTASGLSIKTITNSGAGGSDYYLDNSGSGATVSITANGGTEFRLDTIDLYLSSLTNGSAPTNDGSITLNGKLAGASVYTIEKTGGFPTSIMNGDNGFFNLNTATDGTADFSFTNIDEVEIVLGGSFVYISIDHFEFCEEGLADTFVPEVQSISFSGTPLSTATSLDANVTFNENVTNVTADDFELVTTGNLTATINSMITGSGNQYTLGIENLVGEGTLKVNLKSNTDIQDVLGNTPPLAFNSGQVFTRSECFVVTFESESAGGTTFSSNGFTFEVTGGLDVFDDTGAGAGGSDVFLDNEGTGVGTFSIKTSDGADFSMNTMAVYLSSIAAGSNPTADGTVTITGKENNLQVFTATLNTANTTFPTSTSQGNNGFLVVDFSSLDGNDVSASLVDEIEIQITADFVYVAVDNFDFCQDVTAPVDPVVTIPASAITINAATQTISGTHTENGVVVHAYIDSDNDGTADNTTSLGSATVTGNAWSFSVNLTADSANNFVVQAEDASGNVSGDVDVPIIIEDSTNPANPVVTIPASAITINAATQTISGTHTENGVLVHAYIDSDNDGTADNTTSLGSATVTGNAWSFSVNLTADSANNFVVQAIDAVGNTSGDVDVPTIIEDSTNPANPVVTIPASAITVDAATQTISGTHTENGVLVHAYIDSDNDGTADNTTSLGSATVTGNAWSFSVNLTANSANNFVVQAIDAVGNTSGDVDVPTITEDSTLSVSTEEVFNDDIIIVNPVQEELIIHTSIDVEDVKIYNLSGVMVASFKEVSQLSSGIYIALISTSKGKVVKKILKQ